MIGASRFRWAGRRIRPALTTDAGEGLRGSLLPSGGQKGANIALLIEILAAALTGSRLSADTNMFSDNKGGPPGVGQFMLAIDPAYFGAAAFAASLGRLAEVFGAAKVRLPGSKVGDPANWRETMVDVDAHLWRWSLSLVE